MNPHLQRLAAAAGRFFERLGTWVAGFTFWRFVLFSLLVLIAAGAISSLLPTEPKRPVITITKSAKSPNSSEAPPTPETPPTPSSSSRSGKGCNEDVRVDWTGVHVKRRCGVTKEPDPESVDDEDVDVGGTETIVTRVSQTPAPDLQDLALAVLAVLWLVWFVGRARQKAEARADLAEADALRASCDRQVAEARLQALQAQVEPHFLFNTLGAVEHLIETDPPRAATMQRHLIAFLRGAMPRMRGEAVTLGDEIELCRNYLAIMKIRMEDRLDFTIDLPTELAATAFPPMMLQSVVENAIKHGLEPKPEGGSLWISARVAAGRLRVSVADSGLGFGNGTTGGTGVGLNNIRERLSGLFGNEAALVISPNAPTGTQVTIEIPHVNNGNHC